MKFEQVQNFPVVKEMDGIYAIDNNSSAIYSDGGNTDGMYAYDFNGAKLWEQKFGEKGEYHFGSAHCNYSHVVENGKIYLPFREYLKYGGGWQPGCIAVYKADTGEEIFRSDKCGQEFLVAGDLLYTNDGKKIYCYDITQKDKPLLWKRQLKYDIPYGFMEYMGYENGKDTARPMPKSYKHLPTSYFLWNEYLVVPTMANKWFILETKKGTIVKEIDLNLTCADKYQLYPQAGRGGVVLSGNYAAFVYNCVFVRINLEDGTAEGFRPTYQGKSILEGTIYWNHSTVVKDKTIFFSPGGKIHAIDADTKDGSCEIYPTSSYDTRFKSYDERYIFGNNCAFDLVSREEIPIEIKTTEYIKNFASTPAGDIVSCNKKSISVYKKKM